MRWRRQFPNSGGRRRIPGLSVHCLIRYEAARATHFKMSAGATLSPATQGLPERGLGGSMSWGRGTRVPLARPKALERGNSERDRGGVTQSRSITESKAGAGRRRIAQRKVPAREGPPQREPYRRKVAPFRVVGRSRHVNATSVMPPETLPDR